MLSIIFTVGEDNYKYGKDKTINSIILELEKLVWTYDFQLI